MTSIRSDFYDAHGERVLDINDAAYGEITEIDDDGVELARTYFGTPPGEASAFFQAGPVEPETDAEDWAVGKTTWDLHVNDQGQFRLAVTLDDVTAALGLKGLDEWRIRNELAQMVTYPSWSAAPQQLRAEVYAFLRESMPPSPQVGPVG